jgi:hypothetical protein
MSIAILTGNLVCYCSMFTPDLGVKLPDSSCSNGPEALAGAAAAFYVTKLAGRTGCRLAPVPMERSRFNVHYNDHHLSFNPAEGMTNSVLLLALLRLHIVLLQITAQMFRVLAT